ncbi:hypothetical protein GJAV_G00082480 [Gymnothorax javanicus]|nr:hypothetical protein GJAV_G00082480 [Gymnothorax javanicus]
MCKLEFLCVLWCIFASSLSVPTELLDRALKDDRPGYKERNFERSMILEETDTRENVLTQLLGGYDKVKALSEGSDCRCKCVVRPLSRSACRRIEDGSAKAQDFYTVETLASGPDCKCSCSAQSSALNPCEGDFRLKKLRDAGNENIKLSSVMELLDGSIYGIDLLKLRSLTTKLIARVENIEKTIAQNHNKEQAGLRDSFKEQAKAEESPFQQRMVKKNCPNEMGEAAAAYAHAQKIEERFVGSPRLSRPLLKRSQPEAPTVTQKPQEGQWRPSWDKAGPKGMVIRGITYYKSNSVDDGDDVDTLPEEEFLSGDGSVDLLIEDQLLEFKAPHSRYKGMGKSTAAPVAVARTERDEIWGPRSTHVPKTNPPTQDPATTSTTTIPESFSGSYDVEPTMGSTTQGLSGTTEVLTSVNAISVSQAATSEAMVTVPNSSAATPERTSTTVMTTEANLASTAVIPETTTAMPSNITDHTIGTVTTNTTTTSIPEQTTTLPKLSTVTPKIPLTKPSTTFGSTITTTSYTTPSTSPHPMTSPTPRSSNAHLESTTLSLLTTPPTLTKTFTSAAPTAETTQQRSTKKRKYRNSWTESSSTESVTGKPESHSPAECKDTLATISEPVTQNVYGRDEGAWMKDPKALNDKIYVTNSYNGNNLLEFRNMEIFKQGRFTNSYKLPYSWFGTGHVVYNGAFYYNRAHSRDIIKFDLRRRYVAAWTMLYDAMFEEIAPWRWNGHSNIDFAVDESGLWVIYPAIDDESFHQDVIILSKLNPTDLSMQRETSWRTGLRKNFYGNCFVVCGVLYAINTYNLMNANIVYAYDTHTNTQMAPRLPFVNNYAYTTQITYNPKERILYAWDNRHQVTYNVTFAN